MTRLPVARLATAGPLDLLLDTVAVARVAHGPRSIHAPGAPLLTALDVALDESAEAGRAALAAIAARTTLARWELREEAMQAAAAWLTVADLVVPGHDTARPPAWVDVLAAALNRDPQEPPR